jgi:transposase
MDSDIYMEIIEDILVPFGVEYFGGYYFLHQDNSPIHTSADCRAQIIREGIRWVGIIFEMHLIKVPIKVFLILFMKVKAPANSPDLNPIEYVWADMKAYVRKQLCTNIAQVKQAITEYWERLTPEKCATFISTLQEVYEYIRYTNKIVLVMINKYNYFLKTMRIVIARKGGWSGR